MSAADIDSRVSRVEERLEGHENLCGERWSQLRQALDINRQGRDAQFGQTQDRLGTIEKRISWLAGAGAAAVIAAQLLGPMVARLVVGH